MVQLQTNLAKRSKILIFLRIKHFTKDLLLCQYLKPDGNEPSENSLELQNWECTDLCSWTSSCLETDDCNVPNALSSYLDPR